MVVSVDKGRADLMARCGQTTVVARVLCVALQGKVLALPVRFLGHTAVVASSWRGPGPEVVACLVRLDAVAAVFAQCTCVPEVL